MNDGIVCPECGSVIRRIVDSRPRNDHVRRRCVCVPCNARYTTREMREDQLIAKVKLERITGLQKMIRLIDLFQRRLQKQIEDQI